jgi:hypothetical protein
MLQSKRVAQMVVKEVIRRGQRLLRAARNEIPLRARKLAKEVSMRWKKYDRDVC